MRLLGAALAQREAAGKPLLPRGRASYESMTADAGRALNPAASAAAWEQGRVMTLQEAVDAALDGAPDRGISVLAVQCLALDSAGYKPLAAREAADGGGGRRMHDT